VQQTSRVVIVGFPDAEVLDITGPAEVFGMANQLLARQAYEVTLGAADPEPLPTSGGLRLCVDHGLDRLPAGLDTVVASGGDGTRSAARDPRVLGWLQRASPVARRMTSVCSGAFLLAAAGLLDGRRATTHWSVCDELARRFPLVTVEPDRIWVRDGNVWTSAGVTAGMDLALALVEDDHGPALAREIARWMVLFLQRPGGQAQFSAPLAAQTAERRPLRELQAWITEHPDADLTVVALAERAHMSPRNFARAFASEIGMTPGDFVERSRVETARQLLETTTLPVAAVAGRCGFGTPETLQRAFKRALGVTPTAYRSHFRRTA
jgi:transcriptional regulator GlxA family with amidase domain